MTQTNYPAGYNTVTPSNPQGAKGKNLVIGALAAALLGTWGYNLYNKNDHKEQVQTMQTQSQTYLSERDSVRMLYNDAEMRLDSLTGANHNLQSELDGAKSELQKEINAKKAEIRRILNNQNASAADLKKARTLISELNDKIVNLETEVARLTGENEQLSAANTQLQTDKQVVEQNLQTTTQEKEQLAQKVDVASTFSAANFSITPINEKAKGKEKETTTAKKVDKLVLSFDVMNRIAQSGTTDLYIIVTGPDGKVIDENGGTLSTRENGEKQYTSKINVNYEQGSTKNIQLPIKEKEFAKGNYKIEVYHNGFKIGESVRTLKKGGLFG